MKKEITTNRHHLYPKSKGGTFHNDNIIRIDTRVHDAIHLLFENDCPHEQLQRLLYFSRSALQRDYYERVMKVITTSKEYIYKDGVFLPPTFR